jgi:hypothetical protein
MQKYQNAITDNHGNIVIGATVVVTNYGSGTPAIIYSGNGTGQYPTNVLTTDEQGQFAFYAANGHYTYNVTATDFIPEVYSDILLFDPADYNGGGGGGSDGYWVTPEQYGAVGDGVTDDGPAFTAAYLAAKALATVQYAGGTFYPYSSPVSIICKPGAIYRIKTSIIVQSFTALRGNGYCFLRHPCNTCIV